MGRRSIQNNPSGIIFLILLCEERNPLGAVAKKFRQEEKGSWAVGPLRN